MGWYFFLSFFYQTQTSLLNDILPVSVVLFLCILLHKKKVVFLSIPMDSFPHKPDVPQYAGAKEKVIVHIIDVANDGLRCADGGN